MYSHLIGYRAQLVAVLLQAIVAVCVFFGAGSIPFLQLGFILGLHLPVLIYHKHAHAKAVKGQERAEIAAKKAAAEDWCGVWDIRRTQRKMIEAGIIDESELSTCDNDGCSDCNTTRSHIKELERQKQTRELVARKPKSKYPRPPKGSGGIGRARRDEYCVTCGLKSDSLECGPCSVQRRDDMERAQYFIHQKRKSRGRVKRINGVDVPIPPNVPTFADASVQSNPSMQCNEVLWTWDYGDGRKYGYRSRIPEVETYEVNGARGVIARWQSVNDGPVEDLIKIGVPANEIREWINQEAGPRIIMGPVGPKGPVGPAGPRPLDMHSDHTMWSNRTGTKGAHRKAPNTKRTTSKGPQ